MTGPFATWTVTATLRGDVLTATVSHTRKAAAAKPREYRRQQWDADLAAWADEHTEGDTVEVRVEVDLEARARVFLASAPLPPPVRTPPARRSLIGEEGGFVNPYTFVPTPPRGDLAFGAAGCSGPGPTGLGDAGRDGPLSHARHRPEQWSGFLRLRLTTLTPLLLPDTANAGRDPQGRPSYPVRTGRDDLPLLPATSVKGALRSAYETITASRYGVFRGHDLPLAYRIPANQALDRVPAIVAEPAPGRRVFRLCEGLAALPVVGQGNGAVQATAWVPAYPRGRNDRAVTRLGALARTPLANLHGREVAARVRLYQYTSRRPNGPRFRVWRVTHVAESPAALRAALAHPDVAWRDDRDPVEPTGTLRRLGPSQIVQGWLSITGHSIDTKHDERLFVPGAQDVTVDVGPEHDAFWRSVLRAYDEAAEYGEPPGGVRSRHVPSTAEIRGLGAGSLVYVTTDIRSGTRKVTGVHPVIIGRMPFDTAPASRLDDSLRPASSVAELSPADRVFGWAPAGGGEGRRGVRTSSGVRGRVGVRRVTCLAGGTEWRPDAADGFPAEGVVLAPLSSPKPTQFRFYAAAAPDGSPVPDAAGKDAGYRAGSALRGRKAYRWRREDDAYWTPRSATQSPDRHREYLVTGDVDPSQNARHLGWVVPGVEFEVELFVDGLSGAELGALLWLADLGDRGALRLGAGKPLGFGAVRADLDRSHSRLWTGDRVTEGWRSLQRPDAVGDDRLRDLAARFEADAAAHPVLAEAVASFLAAAAPVERPVHYPRPTSEPVAESYTWFVNNEVRRQGYVAGWALPHARDPEPRLPYLPKDLPDRVAERATPGGPGHGARGRGGRDQGGGPVGRAQGGRRPGGGGRGR